jgi:hypothetical protein
MNQRLVAIAVWSLVLLFALACAAVAWRAGTMSAAPAAAADAAALPGGALWASRCARCHEPSAFSGHLAGADRIAAASAMLAALDTHGGTDFAEDLQLIQWLATQAGADNGAAAPVAEKAEEDDPYTL